MRRARRSSAALVVLTFSAAAACAGSAGDAGRVTVLAAASLTEPFSEIARRFEAAHAGTEVALSFDASSALVRQVADGAPADVVATADEVALAEVAERLVRPPVVFAHNRLTLAVGRGNPRRVSTVPDLARPDVVVVLCSPEVPCGRFAARVLDRAGVAALRPRSYEPNVKAVVAKVALGEADAGIVYQTDVREQGAASGVEGVAIPPEHNVTAAYAIAAVSSSRSPAPASAFVDFVRSAEGRSVLAAAGFDPA